MMIARAPSICLSRLLRSSSGSVSSSLLYIASSGSVVPVSSLRCRSSAWLKTWVNEERSFASVSSEGMGSKRFTS